MLMVSAVPGTRPTLPMCTFPASSSGARWPATGAGRWPIAIISAGANGLAAAVGAAVAEGVHTAASWACTEPAAGESGRELLAVLWS